MYTKKIVLKLQKGEGYLYFNDKEHPLACGNSGKVYYHRHVASLARGKWLSPREVVHHIDEDKTNNEVSNLKVLSVQEHASLHKRKLKNRPCRYCADMFRPTSSRAKYCSQECFKQTLRRVVRPTKQELLIELKTHSFRALGRKYGVSDNAIRKWLKVAK